MPAKKYFVGDKFTTATGRDVVIIDSPEYSRSTLLWLDGTGYTRTVWNDEFRTGKLKSPYDKSVHGVGFLGEGPYQIHVGGEKTREFTIFSGMFERCYSSGAVINKPTYSDCYVRDDWHDFQAFAGWCNSQPEFKYEGYNLDKDLLVQGNKIYGPETCTFIPARINQLINVARVSGSWSEIKQKWGFQYRDENGKATTKHFKNREQGFEWYKTNKERTVKRVADEYEKVIDKAAYEALYSWQVTW